jgi:carboxyl-terminal processing protease
MTARTSLLVTALGAMVSCTSLSLQAKTDFNVVGREMAGMLQNSHYARIPFDEKLSERILTDYLNDLDPAHMYFTKADTEGFEKKYGGRLHELLIRGRCMEPANEIYSLYLKRVKERVESAKEILKNETFDYTKEESVTRSRKEEPWPATDEEAEVLWRLQIKEALLSETLRREAFTRLAEEQGKEDPLSKEVSPVEKITLRYERFLHTVEGADEEDVANYFLSAVARSHDPHTDYMSAREMDRFRGAMANQLTGIGALLQAEDDGATTIMGIVVNGPADKGGELSLNDRIVGVDPLNDGNMVDIMYMKIDHVVELIRGEQGTQVRLKVEPAGGAPGETTFVVIVRDRVDLKDEAATAEVIEKARPGGGKSRIGFLRLPSFYMDFEDGDPSVAKDVQKLLVRLNAEKIDGLVFDLRGNGGGSLEEVRRITGFFVGRGPVVQVKDTFGRIESKDALFRRPLYDGPMVVLTDKSSASASEILAGALQDYNRALIVGDSSTFGKGTVQQPMEIGRFFRFFEDNARAGYLKATIQTFYRVSGSSTQLKGVEPDIKLPSLTDALEIGEAWLDHPLAHDRIRQAPDFKPFAETDLFRPLLKVRSEGRLKKDTDFQYVVEDVERTKKRLAENEISLKMSVREAELKESETRRKARNAERRERFGKMEEADAKVFKFFRLTLDDLELETLAEVDREKDAEAFMRRVHDEEEDLDDTPLWPSGLDVVKREGLAIVEDLIEQTELARTAGVLKKP